MILLYAYFKRLFINLTGSLDDKVVLLTNNINNMVLQHIFYKFHKIFNVNI